MTSGHKPLSPIPGSCQTHHVSTCSDALLHLQQHQGEGFSFLCCVHDIAFLGGVADLLQCCHRLDQCSRYQLGFCKCERSRVGFCFFGCSCEQSGRVVKHGIARLQSFGHCLGDCSL